ncbi:MAG: hypothetical protein J0I25_01530 [Sphingomonadales bacterium]|nr:hypothetical protein [Sphingomonadales bacterium]
MADRDPAADRDAARLAARAEASCTLVAALIRPIAGHDSEQVAAELIATFGGLRQILNADASSLPDRLRSSVNHLRQTEELFSQLLREQLQETMLLDQPALVEKYLTHEMGSLSVEQVRILYLDSSYRLIKDYVAASGTRWKVRVEISKILRKCILFDASAIIIAHNHPSSRWKPTAKDIESTHILAEASRMLSIEFIDHWIVTEDGALSMRAAGLL